MTENFRCRNCDRILTQSDEFDTDECRLCRDRTWKHLFDEADDGTCRACGYLESFGALHLPSRPTLDRDVPEPKPCRNCVHYAHIGPCPDALPGYPQAKPCPCEVAA